MFIIFIFLFLEHNGDDVEYAMIVVDENNSTMNELDSPSMKVRVRFLYRIGFVPFKTRHGSIPTN